MQLSPVITKRLKDRGDFETNSLDPLCVMENVKCILFYNCFFFFFSLRPEDLSPAFFPAASDMKTSVVGVFGRLTISETHVMKVFFPGVNDPKITWQRVISPIGIGWIVTFLFFFNSAVWLDRNKHFLLIFFDTLESLRGFSNCDKLWYHHDQLKTRDCGLFFYGLIDSFLYWRKAAQKCGGWCEQVDFKCLSGLNGSVVVARGIVDHGQRWRDEI